MTPQADSMRAYRRTLAETGRRELVVALPQETIAFLDEFKKQHGLRNRNQVLLQLIEKGREATRAAG
jgi:metal-responsive CopG/Arc/MetJ family transcriptional regulator